MAVAAVFLWLSVGLPQNVAVDVLEAQRMMKVADELPNTTNWSHLSERALYLIATLPDEEKEAPRSSS